MCCLCCKEKDSIGVDQRNSGQQSARQIISGTISNNLSISGLDLNKITILSMLTDSQQYDLQNAEQNISTPMYAQPNGLNMHNQNEVNIGQSDDSITSISLAQLDLEKLVNHLFDGNQDQPSEYDSFVKYKNCPQEGLNDYIFIQFKAASKIYQLHVYKIKQDEKYFSEVYKFNELKKNVEKKLQTKKPRSMNTIVLQADIINYFVAW
ncbi:hypothetical protein TTHERM_000930729 (macronuclear) [Tetrahymena thermophila SB210]|uniref:Uncharacterized protein n=1 Tax=Tetrahymena thermophila (strain SB210) TaxID=312017 RepID=W7WXJ2_TETTS|nr:hypothetical protein TTHERM_000930729 [Tetrahymena thermophila SB210]EWS71525.1 hypothetical protein TTHERM_000930729 [Tetrahymena thermophila SB210]|eukprot:XP_012655936.1 hypothetical protein TTHERM_000930729 [Tetrahymena thermophila SB210]